jgi:hypothetical protein
MRATVRDGPSQTFLNLGFNDSRGLKTSNAEHRSIRYKKIEEPSFGSITRPNAQNFSKYGSVYIGNHVAGKSKIFSTIDSGAQNLKYPVTP